MLDTALGLAVDVLELRVAVRMLRPFDRLVGRLQAVAVLAKQLGHGLVADLDAVLDEKLARQCDCALARPTQRRLRIAACERIDELLECRPHLRVQLFIRALACCCAEPL